jgi:hypothetical protein
VHIFVSGCSFFYSYLVPAIGGNHFRRDLPTKYIRRYVKYVRSASKGAVAEINGDEENIVDALYSETFDRRLHQYNFLNRFIKPEKCCF